ncbi:hypothetical protein K437DRAFT_265777 [Tilletiaria anomala UBC 951]|uniref:ERCC4 domain-containing protein n=1 Tax=Tilletiaria anomala (strain ATCC 24038 / CBS 436.72 / UBC 951) TaxID=1037660 RepID=A0A066WHY9_TILAU|nr:uncharacterized protein K437DRAFT_265777 [Tilletiaria anomala UBC 951]KDN53411.1 hypothetical protein K437DRAFT_265777 [Tilletiaria anomala UBC 951]
MASAERGEVVRHLSGPFLLPFHRAIIASLIPKDSADFAQGEGGAANGDRRVENEEDDEEEDDGNSLVILAKGLGMRRIISTILKIYDAPTNLIVVINATSEEEEGIGEELTTLGVRRPGLRVITHEMTAQKRQELYMAGGLLSVTSRILVVDMLLKRIPTELITGMVVLHAENVTPTSVEAFIVRIFREKNEDGFLKAFSDNPEHFAHGFTPLQTVMGQLQIRQVDIWPRFHKIVQKSLGAQRADVVELHQELSRSMLNIQTSIIECLEATICELKRTSVGVDTVEYTVENAIFHVFDAVVRRQLDPVWHRVSPKTKQLVSDLSTLRQLLTYLIQYDAVTFYSFLETILAANTSPASATGTVRQNQSPWLLMDAANTIFSEARRRVYIGEIAKPGPAQGKENMAAVAPDVIDDDEDEALLQSEAFSDKITGNSDGLNSAAALARASRTYSWLPDGIDLVLEELPKWKLLRDVMREIEEEIQAQEHLQDAWTNNTILVMTSSARTCSQVRELLATMQEGRGIQINGGKGEEGESDQRPGQRMMRRMLRHYFMWKRALGGMHGKGLWSKNNGASGTGNALNDWNGQADTSTSTSASTLGAEGRASSSEHLSEALKRKQAFRGQPPPGKRRRMRGGSATASASGGRKQAAANSGEAMYEEASDIAAFMRRAVKQANADLDNPDDAGQEEEGSGVNDLSVSTETLSELNFDIFFGLLSMQNLVVVRTYRDDEDDKVLQELKPRFIVMYDTQPAFIRRIEVYRRSNPGFGVRLYFMMYAESFEEQRYLSSIRREKESFEKLIREKSSMVLPLRADGRPAEQSADDRLLRTINSRIAGGQRTATSERPRIIVDMREFRSSLPSMLHAAGIDVVPCTLQVGDYILTPDICVERKSLTDLAQSFSSGRLYTQCELMSIHYKHPMLLIEFDQDKSFSLRSVNDAQGKARTFKESANRSELDIQSKLVLLTTTFPRLRIVWSSSPYATADIFEDIKQNFEEPDVAKVAGIGLEDDHGPQGSTEIVAGSSVVSFNTTNEHSFNLTPQDLLRAMPGINTRNYRYIMNQVRDIAELCDLTQEELQELLGIEAGRKLFKFINKDARKEGLQT